MYGDYEVIEEIGKVPAGNLYRARRAGAVRGSEPTQRLILPQGGIFPFSSRPR